MNIPIPTKIATKLGGAPTNQNGIPLVLTTTATSAAWILGLRCRRYRAAAAGLLSLWLHRRNGRRRRKLSSYLLKNTKLFSTCWGKHSPWLGVLRGKSCLPHETCCCIHFLIADEASDAILVLRCKGHRPVCLLVAAPCRGTSQSG